MASVHTTSSGIVGAEAEGSLKDIYAVYQDQNGGATSAKSSESSPETGFEKFASLQGETTVAKLSSQESSSETNMKSSTLNGAPTSQTPGIMELAVFPDQSNGELLAQFKNFLATIQHQNGTSFDQSHLLTDQHQQLLNQMQKLINQNQLLTDQNQLLTGHNEQQISRIHTLTKRNEILESDVLANIGPVFHQFTKLPGELRDMIWRFASDVPRFVHLGDLSPSDMFTLNPPSRFHPYPKQVPAVLRTSRESRAQALKSYELCSEPTASGKSRYLNHECDIVYLPGRDFDSMPSFTNRKWPEKYLEHTAVSSSKLQRLAFDLWCLDEVPKASWPGWFLAGCCQFPNLKEIIFMDGRNFEDFVAIPMEPEEAPVDDNVSIFINDSPDGLLDKLQREFRKFCETETNPHFEKNLSRSFPEISFMKAVSAAALDPVLRCTYY